MSEKEKTFHVVEYATYRVTYEARAADEFEVARKVADAKVDLDVVDREYVEPLNEWGQAWQHVFPDAEETPEDFDTYMDEYGMVRGIARVDAVGDEDDPDV